MKIIKDVNCRVKSYMKEDYQAAQKSPPVTFQVGGPLL